ncbi:MAG: hypothetical protein AB7K37_11800 [Cyclobacteriaceae bacterium]
MDGRLLKISNLFLILICTACTTRTIEDALTSDDFLRWSRDQQVSLEIFTGSGPDNAYSAWVGYYFIYDLRDLPNFRFNVTTILDKTKSYASEINERTDLNRHKLFPTLYKLKFDHYEVYARKFRKYLVEQQSELRSDSEQSLQLKMKEYYDEAELKWDEIMDEIERNDDYSEEHFRYLRSIIDLDLDELKDFGPSTNNYD